MDTSSLIELDTVVTVQQVCRTDLWFQRYDHCVRFKINEAGSLRGFNHTQIDKTVSMRREWGRVRHGGRNHGSWRDQWQPLIITDQDVDNLHQLCDFFQTNQQDRKILISGDTMYVYTTDTSLIHDICNLKIIKNISETQVLLHGTPGTVRLKNPKYQYRSYMRSIALKEPVADNIKNFLKVQEEIGLSPSLKHWLTDRWKFILDYYFIDHNEHSTINMLRLIDPRLIRKTVPIVADK